MAPGVDTRRAGGGGGMGAPATTGATTLRDGILHLPVRADRPGEDPVVVLHEARDGAHLLDVVDGRLHVAGAVHGPAGDGRRTAVPVPAVAEPREHLVQCRSLERRLLPVLP